MELDTDRIYNLANRCKELFAQYAPKDPPSGIDMLFREYEQRFLAWSDYMGVFAVQSMSLDRRLRDRSGISDLVIRFLDILADSLAQIVINYDGSPLDENSPRELVLDQDESSNEELDGDTSESDQEAFEIIEMSLTRLSRLGTTIRQSSDTSRVARTRKFAETLDLAAFETRARIAVDIMYPDSNENLRAQITRSMVETYASILYKKAHQEKLISPRSNQQARASIAKVNEKPDTISTPPLGTDAAGIPPHLAPNHHLGNLNQVHRYLMLESSPSTLGSLRTSVLRKGLVITSPNITNSQYGASSVQLRKVAYPPPPKSRDASNYLTCDWCLESHHRALFDDKKKWSAHLDRDFKPYTCISEKCMEKENLPRFTTFKEWLLHMNNTHSHKWQQEIHAPTSWACTICQPTYYFGIVEALRDHMTEFHTNTFTTAEFQAVLKHSYVERPRSHQICPLCCRDLVEEKSRKEFQTRTSERLNMLDIDGTHGEDNEIALSSYTIRNDDALENDENSGSIEQGTESSGIAMARHIASHLQVIMFLIIRLIKCDSEEEGLEGSTETGISHAGDISDHSTLHSKQNWSSRISEGSVQLDTNEDTQIRDEPETWALLIGVDHYIPGNSRPTKYHDSSSCVNNVNSTRDYLHSLEIRNIAVLTSTKGPNGLEENESQLAEHSNVRRELEHIINKAQAGDLVYIYYSGTKKYRHHNRHSTEKGISDIMLALADVMKGGAYLTGYQLGIYIKWMVCEKQLQVTLVIDAYFVGLDPDQQRPSDECLPSDLEADEAAVNLYHKSGNEKEIHSWLMDPRGCTILTSRGPREPGAGITIDRGTKRLFTPYMLEMLSRSSTHWLKSYGDLAFHMNLSRPTYAEIREFVQRTIDLDLFTGKLSLGLWGDKDCVFLGPEQVIERLKWRITHLTSRRVTLNTGRAHGVAVGAVYSIIPDERNTRYPLEKEVHILSVSNDNPFLSEALLLFRNEEASIPEIERRSSFVLRKWSLDSTYVDVSSLFQRLSEQQKQSFNEEAKMIRGLFLDWNGSEFENSMFAVVLSQFGIPEILKDGERIPRVPEVTLDKKDWIAKIVYLLSHLARFHAVQSIEKPVPPDWFSYGITATSGLVNQPPRSEQATSDGSSTFFPGSDGTYIVSGGTDVQVTLHLNEICPFNFFYVSLYRFDASWGIYKLHPHQTPLKITNSEPAKFKIRMTYVPKCHPEDPEMIFETIRVFIRGTGIGWEDLTLPRLPTNASLIPPKIFISPIEYANTDAESPIEYTASDAKQSDLSLQGQQDTPLEIPPSPDSPIFPIEIDDSDSANKENSGFVLPLRYPLPSTTYLAVKGMGYREPDRSLWGTIDLKFCIVRKV